MSPRLSYQICSSGLILFMGTNHSFHIVWCNVIEVNQGDCLFQLTLVDISWQSHDARDNKNAFKLYDERARTKVIRI